MSRSRSLTTWAVALAIFVAQSNLPAYLAHAQATQQATAQELADIERLFDALEAAAADITRDTFDPQAVLAQTDLTPEGVFAWVRDNTYLVPYQGALRGPVGVLMDRVGNSLDRALLLQDLLLQLGYDARLQNARLTPAAVNTLTAEVRPIPEAGALRRSAGADLSAELLGYAERFDLDVETLAAVMESNLNESAATREEVSRRVAEQTDFLLSVLPPPVGDDAEAPTEAGAWQDHWWVEYLAGGSWIDLDPSLPTAVPSDTFDVAGAPVSVGGPEDLPEDLVHSIVVRVILECSSGGVLEETTLIDSGVLPLTSLFGTHISLQSAPVGWPQDLDLSTLSPDGRELEALLAEQDAWVPMLRVGSELLFDQAFDSGCSLSDAAARLDAMKQVGGAVVGALDAAGDVFAAPAPVATAAFPTAQWLEYEVLVPGSSPKTIRRPVFDVIGPAARTAGELPSTLSPAQASAWRLALAGETAILPLGAQVSREYVEMETAAQLLRHRAAVLGLLGGVDQVDTATTGLELTESDLIPSDLYLLALVRGEWATDRTVYLASPNILTRHLQLSRDESGRLRQHIAFDIVDSGVAVQAGNSASSFASRLEQGVLDTNAEARVAAFTCRLAALSSGATCDAVSNTAEAFHRSRELGQRWSVIDSASGLQDLQWDEDDRLQASRDLQAGYLVVVPELPIDDYVSWWRVDPRTGETLGIGGTGRGEAATTYSQLIYAITIMGGAQFCILGATMGGGGGASIALCLVGAAAGGGAVVAGATLLGVFLTAVAVLTAGVGGLGVAG